MNINARPREHIAPELRKRVLERDGYACRYCQSEKGPFHLDHVYPHSKGGETTFENLVTACRGCNIRKHNKVGIWPMSIPAQSLKKATPKARAFHRKYKPEPEIELKDGTELEIETKPECPVLLYEKPFFWRKVSAWVTMIAVLSYDAYFVFHFVVNRENPSIAAQIVSISLCVAPIIPAWIESVFKNDDPVFQKELL